MLSQERKEEVDGNPPISHALSSQLLLWRQDSAWFRADPERREVTAHAPRGASVTPMTARLGEGRLLPGAELAPRCPAGPAFPWPSSGASALWATPNPAHSAQTSGDRPACVCACECSRARRWRSVHEMPHYNPLGADEWGWSTKTGPGGLAVLKSPRGGGQAQGSRGISGV